MEREELKLVRQDIQELADRVAANTASVVRLTETLASVLQSNAEYIAKLNKVKDELADMRQRGFKWGFPR